MNSLIRRIIKAVGVRWLTGQVRAAAEGRLGPRWAALYWGLAGQKRYLSFVLGLAVGTVVPDIFEVGKAYYLDITPAE